MVEERGRAMYAVKADVRSFGELTEARIPIDLQNAQPVTVSCSRRRGATHMPNAWVWPMVSGSGT